MKSDNYNLTNISTYQAGVVQAAVNRILQKRCDEILKPFGITKNHWLVIGLVSDSNNKGLRIGDIATELGTTFAYLSNTINNLESKKILIRQTDVNDARSKSVIIHKKFLPQIPKIEAALRDSLRETIYSTVSPEDFRTYIKVLFQLQATDENS
ncbi:MAG: MarR family transcriptional regulator [bacterium]|nr:MarR family transcriptional regulator [bacterium]